MPRHCPTCNRAEGQARFYGQFCEYCIREKLLAALPQSIDLTVCKRCDRVWTGHKYSAPTKKAVEDALGLHIKGYGIKLLEYDGKRAKIEITKKIGGDEAIVDKEFEIRQKGATCDDCYKRASGYWEGLVQLRGGEERVKRTEEKISRYIAHTNAFIAKTEEVPNGIDIYISDKKAVNEAMLFLRLKPIVSYTLYGVKQGKRVYRNTYSIHLY